MDERAVDGNWSEGVEMLWVIAGVAASEKSVAISACI
jgi:hypothetical protein